MITKPTLIIDELKCRDNITRMFNKAKYHGLEFRPHFKTHQSLEIGSWFKELGITKITVSTVDMAEYFSEDWKNITIAFPINIREIQSVNEIASRITLNIVVENIESVYFLITHLTSHVNVFFKIDVGYNRTGINPNNRKLIDILLYIIDSNHHITFIGFLGHAGHSYYCRTPATINKINSDSLQIMMNLKAHYNPKYPNLIVSLGDTPTCSVSEEFTGIDEIRPGNFVFYDLTQNKIGSNSVAQIAIAIACPIVAIHQDRSEIVVFGGSVHFSNDSLEDTEGTIFGRVVEKAEVGWGDLIPGMYVKCLSQEHGIISVPNTLIRSFKIGDYLMILPVHSCMAANSMKSYLNINKIITRL